MNAIARMIGVSAPTVLRWVRAAAKSTPLPQSDGGPIEVEIDEMCAFLKKTHAKSGYGKYCVVPANAVSPGIAVAVIPASSTS